MMTVPQQHGDRNCLKEKKIKPPFKGIPILIKDIPTDNFMQWN